MEYRIEKLSKETGLYIQKLENEKYKVYMPYCVGAIPEICIFDNSNELYCFLLGFKKCQQYKMGKIKC